MVNSKGPTLTDAVGMGGVVAQDGFDYQVWEGLVRLPAWLTNPTFEAIIFEGLEDIEARFFAPHAPEKRLLERFQAKSGDLAPKDVKEVFERFLAFENAYPRVTRVHSLVTPRLPPSLKWVPRDALRVRKARPFYAPFSTIAPASDAKLTEDFVKEYGAELGPFAARSVDVTERPIPSRDVAISAFGASFASAFPSTDVGPKKLRAAFESLEALAQRSRGQALERRALVKLLETEVGEDLVPSTSFPIHVRSDRNGTNEFSLEIDASAFSGKGIGLPAPERWTKELLEPLEGTSAWLRSRDITRVALTGSYRLTTSFLLGYSFRSAVGFEIEIAIRDGMWATDDRPDKDATDWTLTQPEQLDGDALVVAVGVLRRSSDAVVTGGAERNKVFDIFKSTPLTDAKAAQAGVTLIKSAVADAASRLGAKRIHLYYAGPAAFGVTIGHRWNGMLPTTLFEFDATAGTYLRSASC